MLQGTRVEAVSRDLGALSRGEQLELVAGDAPELVALLEELKGALREVRDRVEPLLREVPFENPRAALVTPHTLVERSYGRLSPRTLCRAEYC